MILSFIGIIFTIFFVVGIHEAAHFMAARLVGVKVLCFSIGFGKAICTYRDKHGTDFIIAPIPLGGYVKMLDESEGEVPPEQLPFAYNRQPFYKKFLIVMAGPLSNLISAFLLYWLIFVLGYVTPTPIIGEITPRSIAAESGLTANQQIISIDKTATISWTDVVFRLLFHIGDRDHITMEVKNITTSKIQTHTLDTLNWHIDDLKPDPLESIGILPYEPHVPLQIDYIAKDSPAARSPLKMGDKIIAVNHKKMSTWLEVIEHIYHYPNTTLAFTVLRQGKELTFPVNIGEQRHYLLFKVGYLGISPNFIYPADKLTKIQYTWTEAIPHAAIETVNYCYLNLYLLGKMITGKVSLESLGGPITIFENAGNALNSGMITFLSFLAFLSVSIGVINFLPIPGLDGGHLVIQFIESVIKRPLPEKIIIFAYRAGFLLLFFVFFQAFVNDILRLL